MFGFFKKGNGGKKEEQQNFCVESDLSTGVGLKMPSIHQSVNFMYQKVK
jgi:carbon-monoxide dehydrogenase catalytic subunit